MYSVRTDIVQTVQTELNVVLFIKLCLLSPDSSTLIKPSLVTFSCRTRSKLDMFQTWKNLRMKSACCLSWHANRSMPKLLAKMSEHGIRRYFFLSIATNKMRLLDYTVIKVVRLTYAVAITWGITAGLPGEFMVLMSEVSRRLAVSRRVNLLPRHELQ